MAELWGNGRVVNLRRAWRTTAGTTGQSRPFDRLPRPPRSFSLALPSFNVTDKTDCWVGALPVGEMVSGWPRASRRVHQARDRGQAAASKVGSSPAEVKLPASTRAWTRQERPPQAAANSTASADLCAAGASVPPLSHSSADELAHHMSVGVAVWRASSPRTTQQGQA
ncbi:hypothetical protein D9Q98_003983 [Chlorella vulgaris]|uniref:Uncharacterized protein n=1 Tax=Chlorella vulgaris TaxID=3077 RepID=A0A9D4YXP2_CHLVU|nr:hypothetical protein D9Q98_003983 [Chlorella vulgaris]